MNHLPDSITIQQLPDVSDNETIDESEPDAEEEIDQLDSDSDAPPDQPLGAPVPKRPPQSKASERRPGQALLPAVRIENILQADGVLGNLNLSKEGIFLLSIATEEFIKRLVKAGHQRAGEQNRTMVRYNDMAAATRTHYELRFLQDTIPTPRTLASALALRSKREQELVQNDPAMQFQNGRARPQQQHELPQAMSTPTTSGDSSAVIHESLDSGRRCPNPEPELPLPTSLVPGWRPLPSNALNADAEPLPPKKKPHCPRRSYTPGLGRPQPRKNGTPISQNPYPNPNMSTSAITEPTQTWEEWREKSRRLYRTGDDSRRRTSPPSGASSSQQPSAPPESPSNGGALRPLPSTSQWDRSEPPANHADYAEGHRNPPFEHQNTRPSVVLTNGNSKDSPPSQPDHLHETPAAYPQTQESWAGPLTGPGSAFLQGPGGPFPRPPPPATSIPPLVVGPASPAAPVPGRTVYSLDSPID